MDRRYAGACVVCVWVSVFFFELQVETYLFTADFALWPFADWVADSRTSRIVALPFALRVALKIHRK